MNPLFEQAKTQLVAEAKKLLNDQTPTADELNLIDWCAGVMVVAGVNAIAPVAIDASSDVKSAYAILLNIAARHAVIAEFDAKAAMDVFAVNATALLTKVATVAITAALSAA